MKKRILLISFIVSAVALACALLFAREELAVVCVLSAATLLVCVLVTYLSTGFIIKPLDEVVKKAGKKERIETPYAELVPLARLINHLNEDAERRVQKMNEEKNLVLKAQSSKNDFIANITHEMNTPLTSIKGFAELLASGQLDAEKSARAAQNVLMQSERLTSLVACIINYNEIDNEELPLYEVNASRIAQELLETLAPTVAEHSVTLTSSVAENVVIMSRYERVNEIFGNLIRNAIRYNKEGGSVNVILNQASFCVSDTGIGIAEENLERIFDRFFTVDKSHSGKNGGFGLGLAVVKKLCNKAGWKLSVASELGVGTTFTVEF